jgi:hypothetical protein
MWARHFELALALWLALAPFVFDLEGPRWVWWSELGSALALGTLALLAYHPRARRAHQAELAVALWLLVSGRFLLLERAPATAQNEIVVALLVAMLAVVPSRASTPPRAWRRLPPT